MKAKKIIVPILMGVLMAFAMMPMTAWKAYAAVGDYNLYVGGTRVSKTNCDNIKQGDSNWSGKASYDSGSRTLTLQDFKNEIPVTGNSKGISGNGQEHGGLEGALTIKLRGTSHIKVNSDECDAIYYLGADLVIEDDPDYEGVGELIIDADSSRWDACGIYSDSNLTISGCKVTVNARGASERCRGILVEGKWSKCTVENAFVEATAGKMTNESGMSYGIAVNGYASQLTIKDTSEVIASGYKEAIVGPVVNGITGKGWTNTEGTEGEEAIDISDTERALRSQDNNCFKKVHFRNFVPLTIAAGDQICPYDGQTHGESGSVYADARINEKVSVEGLRTSDKLVNVTLNGSASNAGEYPIKVSNAVIKNGDDDVTYDYIINYIPGKLTINPSTLNVTVGSSSAKKTYNGKQQTYNGTVTAKSNDPSFDASKFRYTGSTTVKGTKTGVYTRKLTADDCAYNDPNYKLNYTIGDPATLTIAKAAITIKADSKSSKYGEALKELTYTVSGAYVEGDDLGVKLSTAANKNKTGTSDITVSWNKNANYTAKLVNGKYTVGKKPAPTTKKATKPAKKPAGVTAKQKAPAKIALDAGIKATSKGNKVTASWGNVDEADCYVIYAAYCGEKKIKKLRTVGANTHQIDITTLHGKKFNTKKNLKYCVFAYKVVNGKKIELARSIMAHAPGSKNSKRTNVKAIKVKKASFTLKKGKKARIKAKLVLQKKSRKPLKHEVKFRYASSNKKVARVSKKGTITAVGKGSCSIYVYAVNGCAKKIIVAVK